MRMRLSGAELVVSCVVFLGAALATNAQILQLVSPPDPAASPASGGNGDSWEPILSDNGRFVAFASAANNLLRATNNQAIPTSFPAFLNVYLRDLANGTTVLVSQTLSGVAGGNGNSVPLAISTNGQFVLFESGASNLVARDTNSAPDIFVRDMVNGTTVLVSVATNGTPGNGGSRNAVMTPDGRYVAFVSAANNLVRGDTNGIPDVFVRDLVSQTTTLVTTGAVSRSSLGSSEAPEISDDGRFVAFFSTATNLGPGTNITGDVYLRDLMSGTTTRVSSFGRTLITSNNAVCFNHALTPDGQFVVYETAVGSSGIIIRYNTQTGNSDIIHTNAAVCNALRFEEVHNLDIAPDGRFVAFIANTNVSGVQASCVELFDASTGDCILISTNANGEVQPGSFCDWPTVDPTGRFIGFQSTATDLVSNVLSGDYHLYLHDSLSGATTLLDSDPAGQGSPVSALSVPRLSADARFVAFECADAHLVTNDVNREWDVFLRDLVTGSVELISARDATLPCSTPLGFSGLGPNSVSDAGRFVTFSSEAENLVASDTNGWRDVFVRDLTAGTTALVSMATNGFSADGASMQPVISPDGRYVAFTSAADNLVPNDTNRASDIFMRDLQTGTTALVSVSTNGGAGNGPSYSPLTSRGGKYVLYRSRASNLAPGAGQERLIFRDVQAATNYLLTATAGAAGVPPTVAMTPDGRFVLFASELGTFYVWDAVLASIVYTNAKPAAGGFPGGAAISDDGQRVAFVLGSNLYVSDMSTRTNRLVGSATAIRNVQMSSDGRWLVCAEFRTGYRIVLFDLLTGASALADHQYSSTNAASGSSGSPVMSSDGRFVVYQSSATNIVVQPVPGPNEIYLYDRLSGGNSLLSATASGPANQRSFSPVFSRDGSALLFGSWAWNLAGQDLNHSTDLFAYGLLTASLLIGNGPTPAVWISWPAMFGHSYRVEYQDVLSDGSWQELSGTVTNIDNRLWMQDPAPAPGERFYRVVGF